MNKFSSGAFRVTKTNDTEIRIYWFRKNSGRRFTLTVVRSSQRAPPARCCVCPLRRTFRPPSASSPAGCFLCILRRAPRLLSSSSPGLLLFAPCGGFPSHHPPARSCYIAASVPLVVNELPQLLVVQWAGHSVVWATDGPGTAAILHRRWGAVRGGPTFRRSPCRSLPHVRGGPLGVGGQRSLVDHVGQPRGVHGVHGVVGRLRRQNAKDCAARGAPSCSAAIGSCPSSHRTWSPLALPRASGSIARRHVLVAGGISKAGVAYIRRRQ